jgi:hypothetical protein
LLKLINMEDNTADFEENWSQFSVEQLVLE